MNINVGEVSETDKQILKAIGPLVIVIILFLFTGKFALGQISKVTKQIEDKKKVQSVLLEKSKILSSISSTVSNSMNTALSAMPKSNPSFALMYQLKILSSSHQLALSNIKASVDENMTSMMSLNASFDVTGTKGQIFSFVKALGSVAPMTFVQKLDLSESVGNYTASITTKTYFSPLPTKVPAITQAITDLNSTEKALLLQINSLSKPAISEVISATPSAINTNPFGQ